MESLFETTDVWVASVFVYLYSWDCLGSIRDEETDNRRRVTTYGLSVPSEDAKIVVEEYRTNRLALSSAKSFVEAFNCITGQQKKMRFRRETCWNSPRWVEGKC
jgi:hypothetical protein